MQTILIIDDDIAIGNLEQEVLEQAGYFVERAYSGTEALLLLKENRPNLILLDLMLPGLSGEEILPQIQEIPVIVVSAKAGIDDKVGLLMGGAVDYLTKPFDTKEGAIYGFVGRNGAGKTTLIRLICGLQEPSSGGYTLYGVKNTDAGIKRSRRRMGAVVETPSIFMDMTARDNIRQQYQILGLPSEQGIDELLQLVGLSDTGKKKVIRQQIFMEMYLLQSWWKHC